MTRTARLRPDIPIRGTHGPRRTLTLAPSDSIHAESNAKAIRTFRMLGLSLLTGLVMWAGIIAAIVLIVR